MIPKFRFQLPIALRLVIGLLILVIAGTILLKIPAMTTAPITWLDAAFTATSAVTVTGLSVQTTSTAFTSLGKVILLILIQIGGVGYTFTAVLAIRLLGRRVSLSNRLQLVSSLGLDQAKNPLDFRRLGMIILIVEAIGTLLLSFHWGLSGIVSRENVLFYAVFHSISAFCNAGFDLFAGDPNYPVGIPGDNVSLIILGSLVAVGGLGIPVFANFMERSQKRINLNTRVTILVTIVLIILGWVGLFLAERGELGVLHGLPLDQQLVQSWFQSVSTRTAGFPGFENFNQLVPASRLLVMGLMFIGSAPASMGGGITTGTFAVLGIAVISYARGLSTPQVGKRTIPIATVYRGAAVLTISLGVIFFISWLLLLTNDFQFNSILFEVVSALATCGLSLGVTADLNSFGRILIMFTMFWGRLGAMTIVLALLQRKSFQQLVSYPEETILIG